MRSLMVSAIAVFGLLVVSGNAAEQRKREDKARIVEALRTVEIIADRNILRHVPSGSVIGANLLRLDEWYVLSASEISAVRTLLKERGERYVVTGEFPPQLPLAVYKLVLWGVADSKLVPLDVLLVDDSVSVLVPLDGKGGWYGVRDGKERECLQEAIKRTQEGKEQPVLKARAAGSLPKTAD